MKLIIYMVLFICLMSCSADKKESTQGVGNNMECLDSSSVYRLFTYFPDGEICRDGRIENLKREGEWAEWYEDGIFHRVITYKNGKDNLVEPNREMPTLIFESDSLWQGVETRFKALDLYPEETITCGDNGIIRKLEGDLSYDFVVVPLKGDSIHFYYFCKWYETNDVDTITLSLADIEDLSKYGLTQENMKDKSSLTIIKKRAPTIILDTHFIHRK